MKTKIFTFLFLFIAGTAIAQPDQIIVNGSFEVNSYNPTDHNQLYGNSTGWNGSSTPDLFYIGNSNFRPGCPWAGGSSSSGTSQFTSLPTYITPNSGSYCGGMGASEQMTNELSRATYPNSWVKFRFRYAFRNVQPYSNGVTINPPVQIKLESNDNNVSDFLLDAQNVDATIHNSCQWYVWESEWMLLSDDTYDKFTINASQSPNPQDFWGEEYFYIDDVELFNSINCCPQAAIYEKTNQIPTTTHVIDFIEVKESVNLTSGTYTLKAGNKITVEPGTMITGGTGTVTIDGATAYLMIEDCDGANYSTPAPIQIVQNANVFSPNGDGINDELCTQVINATWYEVIVFNGWGQPIYKDAGPVNGSFICLWDGTCNQPLQCNVGALVSDGQYVIHETFSNCMEELTNTPYWVSVFGENNNRIAGPDSSTTQPTMEESREAFSVNYTNRIFPNPGTGSFIVESEKPVESVTVKDTEGRIVYDKVTGGGNEVKISLNDVQSGVYFVSVKAGDEIIRYRYVKK